MCGHTEESIGSLDPDLYLFIQELLLSGAVGFVGDAARAFRIQAEIQSIKLSFGSKEKPISFEKMYREVDRHLPMVVSEKDEVLESFLRFQRARQNQTE